MRGMHSLRTKITLITICIIAMSVAIVTAVSVHFIRRSESLESNQLLLLLCETGERNLDYYFNSVQKSVEKVEHFAEKDLDGIDALEDEAFAAHVERVAAFFDETANKTNGVLTYYYRIDPAASDTVKGFWYVNMDGEGFVEHVPTDITLYDTQDTSRLVWFTVPKHEGKAIWLPPYITDNLDVRVMSYNVPIYWRGHFIGVAGIELDYSDMAEQVDSIRLYQNGYAFLNDDEGNLFYHPRYDVASLSEEELPKLPEGALSNLTFLQYNFEGQERIAAWLPLSNGMRLNVSVPVSETQGDWQRLLREILTAAALVLLASSAVVLVGAERIMKPLEDLTRAAEQADAGNYDFALTYEKDDEIGRLTKTFQRMGAHMREHISDLSRQAYTDALTSVKNKGAFSKALDAMQQKIDKGEKPEFAAAVFDCDNLKLINDRWGHDKGDTYLKTACRLICRVWQHSPVFRIGGDEFAVLMQGGDYDAREALAEQFKREAETINAKAEHVWEQVHVAMGIADYEPQNDPAVIDTIRRADKAMYANKHRGRSRAPRSGAELREES